MTLLAALAGAVIISFSAIFFALSGTSAVTGGFYRNAYALPVLAVLWLIGRRRTDRTPRQRVVATLAGVAIALDVIAWHTAIGMIGAGLATLIANVSVIFVALGAWIFLGEQPRRVTLYTIPVILVGIALISGVGQAEAFGDDPVLGTLLALVAAIFYATFVLLYRDSSSPRESPGPALAEVTFAAALTTLAYGTIFGGLDLGFEWPAHGWLLGLALGAQVLGWLLIGYALPRLPAVETATLILIQPAMTLGWGAAILSERPSLLQIIGALVVLGGVAFVAITRSRSAAKPALSRPG